MGKFASCFFAALIWLTMASPVWAEFDEGAAAYARGDYAAALREFRAAAEEGNAPAQFNLGVMYANGQGVLKNERLAVGWYRKAAEQGDADAQTNLGVAYYLGRGVPKGNEQAALWLQKAAEQGSAGAQYLLAGMFARGAGLPKDGRQAAVWYRKAAEKGNADAQYRLGIMYWEGRAMLKDDQQAAFWFSKAAEQGNGLAQASLGAMYEEGRGVSRDEQQAYFWYSLAAAQGVEPAVNYRDEVEVKLIPALREKAQTAARDWKPKAAATVDSFSVVSIPETQATPTAKHREVLTSTGSGFFVAGGRVVTNNHVAEGCSRLRVAGQSDGRLLSNDPRNDLALILVQGLAPDSPTIRSGKLRIGESALVAGFPLSGLLAGFNVTTGNISSLAGVRGDTRLVQITAPVQPGNSGGPLLDGAGKVIGVVVSKLDALKVAESTGDVPQNVNFAINANVLASFLDANGVDYKSSPIGPSIPTQVVALRAKAFTVLIECWK